MLIRPYQPTDRNDCIEIFRSNLPMFFDPSELPQFERWLTGKDEGKLAYDNASAEHYYVILLKDKVVGCGGYYIPKEGKNASMAWGMVENSFHKMGVGRNLFEYRVQMINNFYPDYDIILDTTQHSFQFFEKQGFTTTKITPDFYGKGLDRYDMIRT